MYIEYLFEIRAHNVQKHTDYLCLIQRHENVQINVYCVMQPTSHSDDRTQILYIFLYFISKVYHMMSWLFFLVIRLLHSYISIAKINIQISMY